MARSHARIMPTIWADPDFCARSPEAQRLYLLLLSQDDVNQAGVLPLRVPRWALMSANTASEDIEKAMAELVEHRYVMVDEATGEVLIRTFIRNDGVWRQPFVFRSARRAIERTLSRTLRRTLCHELTRLPVWELKGQASDLVRAEVRNLLWKQAEGFGEPFVEPFAEPFAEGASEPFAEGASEPFAEGASEPFREGHGERGKGSSSSVRSSKNGSSTNSSKAGKPASDAADTKYPPEVDELCARLANRVEGNGSKRPAITKGWREAARLMLTRDHRTAEQIRNAIDWCQNDDFWRSNVMSMPTLRKQYDRLRLEAKRKSAMQSQTSANSRPATPSVGRFHQQ